MQIATDRGLSPQAAALGAFETDASHAKASGLTPRAGLLCLPTLSTHGFEVITRDAIDAMAAIVVELSGGLVRRLARIHLDRGVDVGLLVLAGTLLGGLLALRHHGRRRPVEPRAQREAE